MWSLNLARHVCFLTTSATPLLSLYNLQRFYIYLPRDRNEVLWDTDTLRMNWVGVSTTRCKRQSASHSYWHPWHQVLPRDRQYPWNRVRSVSRLDSFAFTTQPGPTPSIGQSVTHSHELRAQHRRENRHDWNQNQILFNLYVHRKCSWLVQKSKSAMIGFLYPQSLN